MAVNVCGCEKRWRQNGVLMQECIQMGGEITGQLGVNDKMHTERRV